MVQVSLASSSAGTYSHNSHETVVPDTERYMLLCGVYDQYGITIFGDCGIHCSYLMVKRQCRTSSITIQILLSPTED